MFWAREELSSSCEEVRMSEVAEAGTVAGSRVGGSWTSRQGTVFQRLLGLRIWGQGDPGPLDPLESEVSLVSDASGSPKSRVPFSLPSSHLVFTPGLGVFWAFGTPFALGLLHNRLTPNFFPLTSFAFS